MTSKVTKKLRLNEYQFFDELSPGGKSIVKEEVGNFVRESILDFVGDGNSPVGGERKSFPGLSPKYKEAKAKQSSAVIPNLELTGDMLGALEFEERRYGVEVGIFNSSEAGKADGHCNFSGKSKLPRRRFIPDDGQKFRRDIESEIRSIIEERYQEEKDGEI